MNNEENKKNEMVEKETGFILARTFFTLKALMRKRLQETGLELTPEQAGLIKHLNEEQGINQRELAANLFKDVGAITRLVDALEKKGLLKRMPDPNDRRSHRLELTPAGQKKSRQIGELQAALKERLFECLSPGEEEELASLLLKLKEHAETLLSDASSAVR